MTEPGEGQTAVVDPAEEAAAPASSAPNIVQIGSHTVTLAPKVTMAIGMAALSVIKQGGSQAVLEAGLAEVYVNLGIVSWDFPEPVTPENIARLLPYGDGGLEVAEAADRLYSNEVLRPLRRRSPELFLTTPTASSTPATLGSGSPPRTPSGRSSRNGTAGKR